MNQQNTLFKRLIAYNSFLKSRNPHNSRAALSSPLIPLRGPSRRLGAFYSVNQLFKASSTWVVVKETDHPYLQPKRPYNARLNVFQRFRAFFLIPPPSPRWKLKADAAGAPTGEPYPNQPPLNTNKAWRLKADAAGAPTGAPYPNQPPLINNKAENKQNRTLLLPEVLEAEETILNQTSPDVLVPSSHAKRALSRVASGRAVPPNINVQQNLLDSRFLVERPNTFWCSDIYTLKYTSIKELGGGHAQVYLVMDLADGRVVTTFVHKKVTDTHIVDLLTPIITAQKRIKESFPDNELQALLIHSDRGEQFRSDLYINMSIVFEGFLYISHSFQAMPTNNSPCERLFRTLFKEQAYWNQVGYPNGPPKEVQTIDEISSIVKQIVAVYNSTHQNIRSLGLTPEAAQCAFVMANVAGLVSPKVWLASASIESGERDKIETYRKQVSTIYNRYVSSPPKSVEELNRSTRMREETLNRQLTIKSIQATESLKQEVELLRQQIHLLPSKKAKRAVRSAGPPVEIRDAFTLKALNAFIKYVLGTHIINFHHLRNAIAVILLVGLGIRINEVASIKHSHIIEIIKFQKTNIKTSKRGGTQAKVMDNHCRAALEELYSQYTQLMEGLKWVPDPEGFFFVKDPDPRFGSLASNQLSIKYYTQSINKLLARFLLYYNQRENLNLHLTTHSGRIGLVTRSFKAGLDPNITRELVGHKSLQTTLKYNRYVITNEQRLDAINKAASGEINTSDFSFFLDEKKEGFNNNSY